MTSYLSVFTLQVLCVLIVSWTEFYFTMKSVSSIRRLMLLLRCNLFRKYAIMSEQYVTSSKVK